MTFYKIMQHVHYNMGKEPRTTWYQSADTVEQATIIVRQLNARNSNIPMDDPERIAVTYSIGC
jgi:hypothetical protein